MTNKEIRDLERRGAKNAKLKKREERKTNFNESFDKFKRCTLATIELYR